MFVRGGASDVRCVEAGLLRNSHQFAQSFVELPDVGARSRTDIDEGKVDCLAETPDLQGVWEALSRCKAYRVEQP